MVACCAALTAFEQNAKLILTFSETGKMARLIAMYKPMQPIIVVSDKFDVVKQMNFSRGTIGYLIPTFAGREELLNRILKVFSQKGLCKSGDKIVSCYGTHEMHPEQSNILNVLEVP